MRRVRLAVHGREVQRPAAADVGVRAGREQQRDGRRAARGAGLGDRERQRRVAAGPGVVDVGAARERPPQAVQVARHRPVEADARLERQVREQLREQRVHAPARACEPRDVGAVQDFLEAEEVVVLEKVAGDLEDELGGESEEVGHGDG